MRLLLVYLFDLNMCECVRVCSISCTWINAYRVFHDLRPWIQSWRRDSVTWSLVRRLTRSTINLVLHFRLDCAAVQTFPLDYLPLTFFLFPGTFDLLCCFCVLLILATQPMALPRSASITVVLATMAMKKKSLNVCFARLHYLNCKRKRAVNFEEFLTVLVIVDNVL